MIYKTEIGFLNSLFNKVEEPDVPESELKFKIETDIDMAGKVTTRKLLTPFQSAMCHHRMITLIKSTDALDSTLRSLYNIIWGKCSKLMQNKLRSRLFKEKDLNGDATWLLNEILSVSNQLEANVSLYDSVDDAKRSYYLYKQAPEE